jgi:glycogen debranching enzyme
LPANLPDEFVGTYRKAVSIMRVNTCTPEGQIAHQWTTPDRWPHRWMWLHDTAYHAAGHVYHFPDLAADMLAAVFDTQDDDGRVALFMEPNQNFPNLSQSPILTWGVRQAYEATANRDFLSEIYPKVRAYLEYFIKTRAFDDTGLYRWLHSDESMDNNPRFDQTSDFAAVDLSCTLCREFEEAATLADALGLDEEVTYWRNRRSKTAEALNELLWDEKTGQYGDLMRDGKLVTLSTCVTFLPLFAGVVPTGRAEQLLKLLKDPSKFWVELPVPTVAADEACFYPDMWRGPAWINMNHLISEGLERSGFSEVANELRQRSLRTVNRWRRHTGCIYEFYDCEDVIPPFLIDRKSRICYGGGFTNISDYHWTSALFVAMCRRVYG